MTYNELLPIVRAARALVAKPEAWSARNYAEDETGRFVPVGDARAAKFNLEGALVRAAGLSARAAVDALTRLFSTAPAALHASFFGAPRSWTRQQALDLLDWTIQQLEPEAPTARSGTHARIPDENAAILPARKRPNVA